MSKPILLIRDPNIEQIRLMQDQLIDHKIAKDYHLFFVVDHTVEVIKLELFNCAEAEDIEIEKLKTILKL